MSAPSAGVAVADRYPSRVAPSPSITPRPDPVLWGDGAHRAGGPLDAEQLERFDRDGVVVVEGLFDREEAAALLAEVHRLAASDEVRRSDRTIIEPTNDVVRSIFEVHRISEVLAALAADHRLAGAARQILADDVYIHQSRVNLKPGFAGEPFYWHSDFETWHTEDGMPAPRAVSCSVALTDNTPDNGPLMVIPGSHRWYVACVGETPADHYKESLRSQELGTPDDESLAELVRRGGILSSTGPAGSVTLFDCNAMHGSNSNITPFPRSNAFLVYNSVANALVDPFAAPGPRPEFIASRRVEPVGSGGAAPTG